MKRALETRPPSKHQVHNTCDVIPYPLHVTPGLKHVIPSEAEGSETPSHNHVQSQLQHPRRSVSNTITHPHGPTTVVGAGFKPALEVARVFRTRSRSRAPHAPPWVPAPYRVRGDVVTPYDGGGRTPVGSCGRGLLWVTAPPVRPGGRPHPSATYMDCCLAGVLWGWDGCGRGRV